MNSQLYISLKRQLFPSSFGNHKSIYISKEKLPVLSYHHQFQVCEEHLSESLHCKPYAGFRFLL